MNRAVIRSSCKRPLQIGTFSTSHDAVS
jgi:hypothetical protein